MHFVEQKWAPTLLLAFLTESGLLIALKVREAITAFEKQTEYWLPENRQVKDMPDSTEPRHDNPLTRHQLFYLAVEKTIRAIELCRQSVPPPTTSTLSLHLDPPDTIMNRPLDIQQQFNTYGDHIQDLRGEIRRPELEA